MNDILRDGLTPTVLGSVLTAAGAAVRIPDIRRRGMHQKEVVQRVAAGVIGFGLAHVVLGSIDLIQNR